MIENEKKFVLNDLGEVNENKEIGKRLDDFIILKVLSKKKFSFIAKVKSKLNDQIYVMKKTDLSKIDDKRLIRYYRNEYLISQKLEHENISEYCTSFKEDNTLYIISKYYENGNLLNLILSKNKKIIKMSEEKLFSIFLGCLNGVIYLQEKGIIHRNIKPSNIILNDNRQVKLIDFKMAVLLNSQLAKEYTDKEIEITELVKDSNFLDIDKEEDNILDYRAPEINKNIEILNYDNKIDVYSLGKVFCYLTFGSKNLPDYYDSIGYSKNLYDLIKEMLKEEPKERPDIKNIYDKFLIVYVNKFFNKSGIDSAIRCLYSYPYLYDYLYSYYYSFKDHKDIQKTILYKFTKCLYNLRILNSNLQNPNKKIKDEKYGWKLALNEFKEQLYKNGYIQYLNINKEIEPIFIINFIIKELSKNFKELKHEPNINLELVDDINTNHHDKEKAYNAYVKFYNHYFNSFISDNFFGTLKTKKICKNCSFPHYKYNFLYFIPFNVEILTKRTKNKNDLNLYDAFDCLNHYSIVLENNKKCEKCKKTTDHNEYKQFYDTPKYLIFYFDRGHNCHYKNFINFQQKIKLNKLYVEGLKEFNDGVIYNLVGVICRVEEYEENTKKRKEKYISFTRLENENQFLNNNDEKQCNLNEIKNTGDIINLFYFSNEVKGINIYNNDYQNNLNNNNKNNNNNSNNNNMNNNNMNNNNMNNNNMTNSNMNNNNMNNMTNNNMTNNNMNNNMNNNNMNNMTNNNMNNNNMNNNNMNMSNRSNTNNGFNNMNMNINLNNMNNDFNNMNNNFNNMNNDFNNMNMNNIFNNMNMNNDSNNMNNNFNNMNNDSNNMNNNFNNMNSGNINLNNNINDLNMNNNSNMNNFNMNSNNMNSNNMNSNNMNNFNMNNFNMNNNNMNNFNMNNFNMNSNNMNNFNMNSNNMNSLNMNSNNMNNFNMNSNNMNGNNMNSNNMNNFNMNNNNMNNNNINNFNMNNFNMNSLNMNSLNMNSLNMNSNNMNNFNMNNFNMNNFNMNNFNMNSNKMNL